MAFDGIFTHYTVNELKDNLLNGRINKVYQVSNYELILIVRANQKTQKLLISIHPNYARLHTTESEYPYPQEPPMFCMLLRKHLEGGIINEIKQKDNDRVIIFHIEHMNEIGDKDSKILIVEIMGKHSNVVLVNEKTNIILDSIKHISPFLSSVRTLQPGAVYIYPPSNNKVNFFQATEDDFSQFNYLDTNLSKQLIQYFEGLSPLAAKELIFNAAYLNGLGLYQSYLSLINDLKNHLNPSLLYTLNKVYFYLIPLKHIDAEVKSFTSLGELLDRFYFNKENHERIKQQTQDLEKFIKNELEKNKNKLNNLETDLYMAHDSVKYKVYGDLIIANSYHLTKGKTSLNALNYENNEEVVIELDPLLTPIENSQKYFVKYQKGKNAIGHIHEQILLTHQEIEYFDRLLEQMHVASLNDAVEIRQELEEGRYLKRNVSKQKKNKKPQYDTYIVNHAEIFVGKNNLQNEYITHKLAQKNDTFMHVKNMPGAHVIIRCNDITEEVLRAASQLASYYSKGKLSSSVPVDYTLVKNVKKIPGSKIGLVTYDNQKTIYIDPDEDFIHSLKKK